MADHEILEFALHLIAALAAHGQYLHRLAERLEILDLLARELDDRAVEAAAQPALGRHHHQEVGLIGAGAGQKLRPLTIRSRGGEAPHHLVHAFAVGAPGFGRILRAAQLRRRHHLHGLGDLASVLDTLDPVFQVLEAWHLSNPSPWATSVHAKVSANSSMAARIFSSSSPFTARSLLVMSSRRSLCFWRRWVSRPASKRVTSFTSIGSR